MSRFIKENSVTRIIYEALIFYPTPKSLSYFWNFGVLALVFLVIQIITGIFLAMYYTADISASFNSVEYIMRNVNNGWLIRYLHSNGASMFFIVVYIHMLRGLYYNSYIYPRQKLWNSGVVLLLLMVVTAFLGYVLPWGQMSFWGATVITNLVSAIPLIGDSLMYWLWGGFSVDNPTLTRFFSLHFTLPFIIFGISCIHLLFLHEHGSNNGLGVIFKQSFIFFSPYYIYKDLVGILLFFYFYFYFVFFSPNFLGHPDNYIPANSMITPPHIVPEWYFLPFYAILRSISSKLGGVFMLALAIIVLFIIPYLHKPAVRSCKFKPYSRYLFWYFVLICLVLGWVGGKPIEEPYYEIGQYATIFYFLFLLVFIPLVNLIEGFFYGIFDGPLLDQIIWIIEIYIIYEVKLKLIPITYSEYLQDVYKLDPYNQFRFKNVVFKNGKKNLINVFKFYDRKMFYNVIFW